MPIAPPNPSTIDEGQNSKGNHPGDISHEPVLSPEEIARMTDVEYYAFLTSMGIETKIYDEEGRPVESLDLE